MKRFGSWGKSLSFNGQYESVKQCQLSFPFASFGHVDAQNARQDILYWQPAGFIVKNGKLQ